MSEYSHQPKMNETLIQRSQNSMKIRLRVLYVCFDIQQINTDIFRHGNSKVLLNFALPLKFYNLPGWLINRIPWLVHRSTQVNNQPVQKISQKLISTLLVVGMVLLAKNCPQFCCGNSEINQRKYFNDVLILQLKGNSQFL